jgi:hypothetical protein
VYVCLPCLGLALGPACEGRRDSGLWSVYIRTGLVLAAWLAGRPGGIVGLLLTRVTGILEGVIMVLRGSGREMRGGPLCGGMCGWRGRGGLKVKVAG